WAGGVFKWGLRPPSEFRGGGWWPPYPLTAGEAHAGVDRAGQRASLVIGEAAFAAAFYPAAHRLRPVAVVIGGRNAPVMLAAHHRLGNHHLVIGEFGIALEIDAPCPLRAGFAGEAAELDEVAAVFDHRDGIHGRGGAADAAYRAAFGNGFTHEFLPILPHGGRARGRDREGSGEIGRIGLRRRSRERRRGDARRDVDGGQFHVIVNRRSGQL